MEREGGSLPHRVKVLNNELFPTLGIPTIPTYKLFEGLPRSAFFSGAAASNHATKHIGVRSLSAANTLGARSE